MANGAAPARILEMPHLAGLHKPQPRTWLVRRLYDIAGTSPMPDTKPGQTPEFHINYATITVLVVLLSAVVGGWVFMWRTADAVGYERGKAEVERQQLLDRLKQAEQDAADSKKLSAYQAGAEDAHNAQNKKGKK